MARDYGPNGKEVQSIIARAQSLTLAEAQSFLNYWDWSNDPQHQTAFYAVQQAVLVHPDRGSAYDAAYEDFSRAIDTSPGGRAMGNSAPTAIIRDLVTAAVASDLIAQEHYQYLMRPWREVIELGRIQPPPNMVYTDFSAPATQASGCLLPAVWLSVVFSIAWASLG